MLSFLQLLVGVACCHHDALLECFIFLTQKPFVHDNLFEIANFFEGIELVEEYPDLFLLVQWVCFHCLVTNFEGFDHWFETFCVLALRILFIRHFILFLGFQGNEGETSVYVEDFELVVEQVLHNVSEEGCLADSCLSHYDDWYFGSHSIDNEANLEEVVDVYYISRFTVNTVFHIAWDVP